jgi:membrane-associated protease RseP (regulator of RpoE activity)
MKFCGIIVFGLAVGLAATMLAQTQPAATASLRVSGTITAVDPASHHLSMKSDKGEDMTVETSDRTAVLRAPPGETDVKKWTRISVSDLAVGDRVFAVSKTPIEGKVVTASSIVVMSKADVAKEHQEEQDDWKKRGATGNVTAIDAAAKNVTLKVGARTLTVQMSDKTEYHRYSLDSFRFQDASPSNLAEIKVGDQMKVLGNKTADGTGLAAEKVVFGAFRQLAATIVSVDAAKGEMTVKDLAVKKPQPLTIRIDADSTMKKLSPMMAQMLARRYAPGAQQGGEAGGRGPGGEGRGAGPGGPGGRGGRGGDIGQMIDSLPLMPITELKAGDAVMVMTTIGSDPSRVTATMLLAGVEPLLTASPSATRDIMSGWNLGGGGGGEGQ